MTTTEMLDEARQAVQDGRLSWQDYDALVLALTVDPKHDEAKTPPAGEKGNGR